MSYYMHNVPGRLRVKTPIIKGNPKMASQIETMLGAVDGITTVSSNTVTGSIVVNYDPLTVSHQEVVDTLTEKGYFDRSRAVTNDHYFDKAASTAGRVVGKAVFGAVVDMALEGSALSLLAVLL
jgi:copper chaperone CopZ